jgi:hypothetical protein
MFCTGAVKVRAYRFVKIDIFRWLDSVERRFESPSQNSALLKPNTTNKPKIFIGHADPSHVGNGIVRYPTGRTQEVRDRHDALIRSLRRPLAKLIAQGAQLQS